MEVECEQNIQFTNVFEGETFTFSLILVKGWLKRKVTTELEYLVVHYLNNSNVIRKVTTEVRHNKFILLLDLEPGKNEFTLNIRENTRKTTFFYVPPIQQYVVTPVYISVRDGNESTREDDTMQSFCDKILLGCRLVQTLIAETLFHCGLGKKTFLLEDNNDPNKNGNNRCVVFNTTLPLNASDDMSFQELWEYFGRELMTSEYGSENRKFLAFFSHKNGKYLKQLAIGGGGLALCDAEYLNMWPTSVDDLNHCFTNDTSISGISPLSSVTHSYWNWNCFGASIGAVCHELCHTFDLGHTVDGIMGKDFNRINLIFLLDEDSKSLQRIGGWYRVNNESLIVSKGSSNRKLNINHLVHCVSSPNADLQCYADKKFEKQNRINGDVFPKIMFWSESCATLLAYHRWINHKHSHLETTKVCTNINHSHPNPIRYDHIRGIITSVHGIVVVQLRNLSGYILKSWKFCAQRKKTLFLVPICEARRASVIVVEDVEGNLLKKENENLF